MKHPTQPVATLTLIELLSLYESSPNPNHGSKQRVASEVMSMVERIEKLKRRSQFEEYLLKREKFCDKRIPKFARELIKDERPRKIDREAVERIAEKYLVDRLFVLKLWGVETGKATREQRAIIHELYAPFPSMTRAEEVAADLMIDAKEVATIWRHPKRGRDWRKVNGKILKERPVNGDFKRRPKGVLRKADRVAAEFFTTRSKVMRLWRNGAPSRVSGPS